MSKPKVLIIGCTSVGLLQGYYLSSGTDITYLVRPGRKPAFLPPKHLYSYKDNALHTFSSYRIIESVAEVAGETFAFIFDTLDGHTARSESGVATLQAVGDLINEKQNANCFVLYDAIGLDMDVHYTRAMRIAPSRISLAMSMLAHPPTPSISVPSTADPTLVEKANMLYVYSPPNVGLLVFNTQPTLTVKLEEEYNTNGKLVIQRLPAMFSSWAPLLGILHLMVWKVDGFKRFEDLRANNELWRLILRAQTEILILPRFGWMGWALSWITGGWAAEKLNMPLIEGAKPLKFEEFNAFHHGAKVAKQDLRTLEDLLSEGGKAGRKMGALREVVKRVNRLAA